MQSNKLNFKTGQMAYKFDLKVSKWKCLIKLVTGLWIYYLLFSAAVRIVLGATGFEINYFLTKNKNIRFLNNITLCGRARALTLSHTHTPL